MPSPKKPGHGKGAVAYSPERASVILAYAEMAGDQAAADRFGCCLKTVTNYRSRMRGGDAVLAGLYASEKTRLVNGVREDIILTIRAACTRARQLLPTEPDVHKVMGAVKVAGELITVRDAMAADVVEPLPPREGEAPPPAPAGSNGANGAAHHEGAIN